MSVWTNRIAARRTFLKIQSVCRQIILCLRSGFWDFVELKGVSVGLHQIALIYELVELVMVCRASHTNSLSDRHGGQSKGVVVRIGG